MDLNVAKKELILQEEIKTKRTFKELNLMDDFLFDITTENLENCKYIIELSLGIELKSLKWKQNQKVLHNIPGKRGIRMDFIAESVTGEIFDVEMQKRNEGNIGEGVESSLIDFLHYISDYKSVKVDEICDNRLQKLHNNIQSIKESSEMEAEFMKAEERERQIREEGLKEGLKEYYRFMKLTKMMIEDERYNELKQASEDINYCQKLYQEYRL